MRRIVTFNNVSADGYFAADDGGLDWVVPDPDLNRSVMDDSDADTCLFGRVTYQQFESYWPRASKDPALPPDLRAFADSLNDMTKVVFSKTLKQVTWKNSKLLRDFDPREIEKMKNGAGGDIIVFGSGSIARRLSENGLIDEHVFILNPVLLGRGKSLLGASGPRTTLDLVEGRPFKSGNVLLRYVPKKGEERVQQPSGGPHARRVAGR